MFSRLIEKPAVGADASEITHEDLELAIRKNECVVVDVREPQEFSNGHIPGAINQPLSRSASRQYRLYFDNALSLIQRVPTILG